MTRYLTPLRLTVPLVFWAVMQLGASAQVFSQTGASPEDLQRQFIERFYQNILGRASDPAGLSGWLDVLRQRSPDDVVFGFFFSPEFINRNHSDDQFVRILYRTLFDREADAGGYQAWMGELARGVARRRVIEGFTGSVEFNNLVASFGITSASVGNLVTLVPPTSDASVRCMALSFDPDFGLSIGGSSSGATSSGSSSSSSSSGATSSSSGGSVSGRSGSGSSSSSGSSSGSMGGSVCLPPVCPISDSSSSSGGWSSSGSSSSSSSGSSSSGSGSSSSGTTSSSGSSSSGGDVDLPTGRVVIWKHLPSGKWSACGPVQCLWTRYDSYQQAYDLVTQNRHEITFRGASFGACEAITVRGMRSWDLTTEEVYDGARPYCFGEGSRPNCGTATCNAIKLNECISLYASGRADLIEKAEQICPPREQLGM